MIGSLYFIQEGPGGAIKIGWTSNCPHRRRDNLQIGNSHDLVLLGILPDVPMSAEAEWHERFRPYLKRSEWFWPAGELLAAINCQLPAPPRLTARVECADAPHPLKAWLADRKLSVKDFCEGRAFSYVTVYKLLKNEKAFSLDMLFEIAAATGNEVTAAMLIEQIGRTGDESEAA